MAPLQEYTQRKIIHVDMDAFFAAIEERDHPEHRGKPIIISADPRVYGYRRGVVSTCNYEARKYGVKSAMSSVEALQKCPKAVWIQPNMSKYKQVSAEIMEIFFEYTDLVEALSLDEAFLDLTNNTKNEPSATKLAIEIIQKIKEKTNLTASAGVSFNKFLAKCASDYNKPYGITVISPERAESFIDELDVNDVYGIGKKTAEYLKNQGFNTCKDLKKLTPEQMQTLLNKRGLDIYYLINNMDLRPVTPVRERKSIGHETTFVEDLYDMQRLKQELLFLIVDTCKTLTKHNIVTYKITIKIKYHDHTTRSSSRSLGFPTNNIKEIYEQALPVLESFNITEVKPIRLLGISFSEIGDFNT